MADLAILQQNIGVRFKDTALLEQALVHSSYVNENPGTTPDSNERLEFLGDSVLGMVIADELYNRYPQCSEGEMTRMRSAIVRGSTLSRIANNINLGDYIYLGKGEEANGGRHKEANLAGAMEAVIAAVFLSHGLETARELILRLFAGELDNLADNDNLIDYKSRLQHLYQSKYKKTPTYYTMETADTNQEHMFTAEVKIDEEVLGTGHGRNKKAAETSAARSALKNIGDDFTR